MFENLPTPQEIEDMCIKAISRCPQTQEWQCDHYDVDTYKEAFERWRSSHTLWASGYSKYLPRRVRSFLRPDVFGLYEQIEELEKQNKRRGEEIDRLKLVVEGCKNAFTVMNHFVMVQRCDEVLKG